MKHLILTSIVALAFLSIAHASMNITINGQQAKKIYNYLTGTTVKNEGAAGHFYRAGKNIQCRYTNADMADKHGHEVDRNDTRRYVCVLAVNKAGLISTGAF